MTDQLQEQASLYAAGAMPEDERLEYARHLEEDQCPVCRLEVDELQAAMGMLAFSVPAPAPSASVRIRLMEQARAAAPARPAQPFMRRHWLELIAGAVAAASFAALLVTTRANEELRRFTSGLITRIAELETEVSQQRTQLATLSSRDLRVVSLAGQGTNSRASGTILWSPDQRKWLVYVHDLPPAPQGRVYQLWFVTKDGKAVDEGVVETGVDGFAQREVDLRPELTDLNIAAVTLEPSPGQPQPTGDFVLKSSSD